MTFPKLYPHATKKILCHTIEKLIRYYGVRAEIFFPIKDMSIFSGANDRSIEYNEEPDLIEEVFIPDVFGEYDRSVDFLNTWFDDDNKMYVKCDSVLNYKTVPTNSLVKILKDENNQLAHYRVNRVREIRYATDVVLYYYEIVPVNIPNKEVGENAFDEGIDLEGYIDFDIDTDENITELIDKENIDNELKRKDELLKKRRINRFHFIDDEENE